MIVYGDLLFLINFSMDFLCFYLSCLLFHRRLPTVRACVASTLGGIYSVAVLFIDVDGFIALLFDALVLIVMCFCVYFSKKTSFSQFIKAVFLYFFVSALLGGFMTALFSLFNKLNIFGEDVTVKDGISVWIFAFLALIGAIFTMRGGRIFRSSSKKEAELHIVTDKGAATLRALVDSGNLAVEPISERAVVFATLESCKNTLEEDMFSALSDCERVEELPLNIASKIRLIPSATLAGKALLPAVRFKNVCAKTGNNEKKIDVFIAFTAQGAFGEYDAIISDETII